MSKRSIASPSPPPEAKRPRACDQRPTDSIYRPLPKGEFIRVLKLQPGETEQDIECSLEVMGIETSKSSYEAISYVWGDANDTVDVQCNGLQVPITVSLADALRNFRHSSEPRLLWADALCINQRDDQEKGHQVKRMGQVYANAKCVLVWLGCDVQNVAEDAFAVICEANAYFEESMVEAGNRTSRIEPFTNPYPISIDQDRWSGVARLFEHPWFRRVWTVQEAAIAEECCMSWGLASIDIADVLEICVWFWAKSEFYDTIRSIVGEIDYIYGHSINLYFHYNAHRPEPWQLSRAGLTHMATLYKEKSFCVVLGAARYLKATDPRDHVYAFLGCSFAKDSESRTLVEADYTSSMHDLNVRLAYALMKNPAEGRLILSAIRHDCRESLLDDAYISWVPTWHIAAKSHMQIENPSYWYRAGGSREFFATTRSDKNLLAVGGCIFDKVIWMSNTIRLDREGLNPMYPHPTTPEPNESFIDTLWDHVIRDATELGIPVRQDDFIRTSMIGYPRDDGISDELQRRIVEPYTRSIRTARPSGLEVAELTAEERSMVTWFESELRALADTRLFLTENGRIGLVSLGELVEVGDVCCIIFGATVPFLLTPAKGGRHKLIGECYIQGVMDGEIMQQFDESDLSKHSIVLE